MRVFLLPIGTREHRGAGAPLSLSSLHQGNSPNLTMSRAFCPFHVCVNIHLHIPRLMRLIIVTFLNILSSNTSNNYKNIKNVTF